MLSVAILINGEPIMARAAVRGEPFVQGGKGPDGRMRYRVDDGSTVLHRPEDGAVALAIKLLETIQEPNRAGHKPARR